MNIMHYEFTVPIPLSKLSFLPNSIKVLWNNTPYKIPYTPQTAIIQKYCFIDDFKKELKHSAELKIRRHRLFRRNIKIEIIMSEKCLDEIKNLLLTIENAKAEIRSKVISRSLTIDEAEKIFNDRKINCSDNIVLDLTRYIVKQESEQSLTQTVKVPLGEVTFKDKYITFTYEDLEFTYDKYSFRVDQNKLNFESSKTLNDVKNLVNGNIAISIYKKYKLDWPLFAQALSVTPTEQTVTEVKMEPSLLEALKEEYRKKIIAEKEECRKKFREEIEDLGNSKHSIDEVRAVIRKWYSYLTSSEIGATITELIPPWKETIEYKVPAKKADYSQTEIVIYPYDYPYNAKINIPKNYVPFDSSEILNHIKEVFKDNILVTRTTYYRMVWDEKIGTLSIINDNDVFQVIAEDKFITKLKLVNVIFDNIKTKYSFYEAIEYIKKYIKHYGVTLENYRVPHGYDLECLKYLEKLADEQKGSIHITDNDMWFIIDKYLIWEEPEPDNATYVFYWGKYEYSLPSFIASIWSSTKTYIISHPEEYGLKARVFHNYDDMSDWRRKLSWAINIKTSLSL